MTAINITNVWINAEIWAEGRWTPDNDIVDIVVTVEGGDQWAATICSYKHVQVITERWAKSGECLGGRYLWAVNLILATDTSRESIEALLNDLIVSGEFKSALGKLSEE